MKISKLTLSLYLALIFLSGAAVGVFGYRLYSVTAVASTAPDPNEFRKRYVNELTTRLHLRPDQLAKLNAIFDETRARFDDLDKKRRQQMRPEMDEIRNQQRDKVREMLEPSQRPEYEKILQEHAEARKRREAQQQQQGQPGPPPAR